MNTINGLLEYVESGNACGPELQSAVAEIGDSSFRVVCIKILGWMKSQHRLQRLRPLRLEKEYDWCENIRVLLREKKLFLDLFQICDDELNFSSAVSEEMQKEGCATVNSKYAPPLMT